MGFFQDLIRRPFDAVGLGDVSKTVVNAAGQIPFVGGPIKAGLQHPLGMDGVSLAALLAGSGLIKGFDYGTLGLDKVFGTGGAVSGAGGTDTFTTAAQAMGMGGGGGAAGLIGALGGKGWNEFLASPIGKLLGPQLNASMLSGMNPGVYGKPGDDGYGKQFGELAKVLGEKGFSELMASLAETQGDPYRMSIWDEQKINQGVDEITNVQEKSIADYRAAAARAGVSKEVMQAVEEQKRDGFYGAKSKFKTDSNQQIRMNNQNQTQQRFLNASDLLKAGLGGLGNQADRTIDQNETFQQSMSRLLGFNAQGGQRPQFPQANPLVPNVAPQSATLAPGGATQATHSGTAGFTVPGQASGMSLANYNPLKGLPSFSGNRWW